MVKIVHPVAYELAIAKESLERAEEELIQYKKENKQPKKELNRLHEHMKGSPGMRPPTSTTTSSTKISAHPQTTPRYAKATKASESKTVEAVRSTSQRTRSPPKTKIMIKRPSSSWTAIDFLGSVLPEEFGYRDGTLIKKVYGFLRPTQATACKTKSIIRHKHTCNKEDSSTVLEAEHKAESAPKTSEDSTNRNTWAILPVRDYNERWRTYRWDFKSTKTWLHCLKFNQAPHMMSDQAYEDIMKLHMLPLETRLEDTCNDWLAGPLGHLIINDEFQFRLLLRARELAQ